VENISAKEHSNQSLIKDNAFDAIERRDDMDTQAKTETE